MNNYRINYWYNGNRYVTEIRADSIQEAEYLLYMDGACDDIISVNLVGEY